MAGSLVTGAGAPTAVVEVQPGMLVQAVTLVDENGLPVSAQIATALATTTTPVNVSAATAPTTGQVLTATSASAATWQTSPDFVNPMTTLGDEIYGGASGAATRLAGNTSATKKFLTGTGTGSAAQAPAWAAIVSGDLPAATTIAGGAVQLAGDLGGTATAPVVEAVHGTTVPAAPVSGQVLTATSGTTATWQNVSAGVFGFTTYASLGYVGATAPYTTTPNLTAPGSGTYAAGTLCLIRVDCIPGASVNGYISFAWQNASGMANSYFGLYNSAGAAVGSGTADLSSNASTYTRAAVTGFTAIPSDGIVYVIYLNGTSGVAGGPKYLTNAWSGSTPTTAKLPSQAAAPYTVTKNTTGATGLPGSLTLSSFTVLASVIPWIAID